MRGVVALLLFWFALATSIFFVAKQNFKVPGLYYDEAIFAGLAKDFITGQLHHHMPGVETINFLGRPFPLFVESYLGALKPWMLLPTMWLFGPTVSVFRLTTLLWTLLGLLFFMLAVRRWLGLRAAIIAGVVLGFDPVYFFLATLDWGAATTSFFCRCLSLYLAIAWWRRPRWDKLFFSAFFLGLAFFNKVDVAAVLVGTGTAALCFYGRQLWSTFRAKPELAAIITLGFLAGAGPMLFKLRNLLVFAASGNATSGPNELSEKSRTLLAMYDGSYFYRLMNAGGVFEKMYEQPAVHSAFCYILILAIIALLAIALTRPEKNEARLTGFLLTAFFLSSLFVFFVPEAVRIHHAVLAYPFPQLIIAVSINSLWQRRWTPAIGRYVKAGLGLALAILLASQSYAIFKTEELIGATGGRGRWSEALDTFCRENKNRSDLTLMSLDWGFNEQLLFLTDGPKTVEAFWGFNQTLPPPPRDPNYIYLAHSPEYSVFRYDAAYLKIFQNQGDDVEITPHLDRQNQPAFYTIRFLAR